MQLHQKKENMWSCIYKEAPIGVFWYTKSMNSKEQKINEIQQSRLCFRVNMQVLQQKKQQLFSLFRSKLEEKKIEEIKRNLSQ